MTKKVIKKKTAKKSKSKPKSEVKPVFWLSGNYYECRKIWQSIVKMTTDKMGEPNIISIECGFNPQDTKADCRVAEAAEVRGLIRTKDIFDARPRIIRMVGIPRDYADILDYLRFVRDDNILVIDSPIGYYNLKTFVSAASSNFYKHIKEYGKVFKFDERAGNAKDACNWVFNLAKDLNRKITTGAIELLVEVKGLSFDVLYCEVLKLFDYSDEEITVDDVKECSIPVFERLVWEFIEALNRQRYDDACEYVERYLDHISTLPGYKYAGAMEQTVGALNQNFEMLVHAKDCCPSSLSYNPLWNGIENLKRCKDKEWVAKFSKGVCFGKIKDTSFQLAYGWPKSRIYGAWLVTRHLHPRMRYDSSSIPFGFHAICMYVCGKLDERQALIFGGYSPEEVDGIVG